MLYNGRQLTRKHPQTFETLFYIYYYILEIIIMKKIIATIALVAFASSASAFFGGDDNQSGYGTERLVELVKETLTQKVTSA